MFGVAVASLDSLSEAERARYQAVYCGLCHELERRYGQVSRTTLSYDLAFLVMLYDSLYEPVEETGRTACVLRPRMGRDGSSEYAASTYSSYCADLSVAFAYHKCLDDIEDDRSLKAIAMRQALAGSYRKASSRIPEQCEAIAETMRVLREYEEDSSARRYPALAADAMSKAFGEMLGFVLESEPSTFSDIWRFPMGAFGYALGRFVYLMDAAVDFEQDERNGTWNPFVLMQTQEGSGEPDPMAMRDDLSVVANEMCIAFERLPLVQDAHIMRSVLYSGVWQKFNHEYERSDHRIGRTGPHGSLDQDLGSGGASVASQGSNQEPQGERDESRGESVKPGDESEYPRGASA